MLFENYAENVKYRWNKLLDALKEFFVSLNCSNAFTQPSCIDNNEIDLKNENILTTNTDLNIILTECDNNNSNDSLKIKDVKEKGKSKSRSKSKNKKELINKIITEDKKYFKRNKNTHMRSRSPSPVNKK